MSILIIAFIGILQLPIFSEVLERMSSMVDAFTGTGGDSSAIVRMALVDNWLGFISSVSNYRRWD